MFMLMLHAACQSYIVGATTNALLMLYHCASPSRFVEEGLYEEGKNFSTVARIVGDSKTVHDTVEFYYNWKYRSPAYLQWVRRRGQVSVCDAPLSATTSTT
jgi:hypothetical protein